MLNSNLDDNLVMATNSAIMSSPSAFSPSATPSAAPASFGTTVTTTNPTLTRNYEEENEGPDLNISKLVLVNNVTSQEWKRSTPLKTYSKKTVNTPNMAAVSRYGRSHKPRIADDYLSTDKKVSHYLKIDADNQLHYFKSSPYAMYKSPNSKSPATGSSGTNSQQPSPRKRGRPPKIRSLSDSGISSVGCATGLSTPDISNIQGGTIKRGGVINIGSGEKLRHNTPSQRPSTTITELNVPTPTSTETLPIPPELMDQAILGSSDIEEVDTLSEVVDPLGSVDDLSATCPPGTTVEMGPDGQPRWMVGDLAWACVGGFPYWPCTVTRDPFENAFTKLKFVGKYRQARDLIHVRFFGDHGRRSWIYKGNILPFQGLDAFLALAEQKCTPKTKKKFPKLYKSFTVSTSVRKAWQAAVSEAESLKEAPRSERVKYFTDAFPGPSPPATPTKLLPGSQENRTPTTIVSSGSKKRRKSLQNPSIKESQAKTSLSKKRKSDVVLNNSSSAKKFKEDVQIKIEPEDDLSNVDMDAPLKMEIKEEPESPVKKTPVPRGRPRKIDSKSSTPINQPQLVVSLTQLKLKGNSTSPAVRGRGRPRKTPKLEDSVTGTPTTTVITSTPTSPISTGKKKVIRRSVGTKKTDITSNNDSKNSVNGEKKLQAQIPYQEPTALEHSSLAAADNLYQQERKKFSKLGPGFTSFYEKHFDQVADEDPSLTSNDVDRYLEKMWSQLSDAVKARYRSKTQEEKEIESESETETDSRRSPPQTVTSGSKPIKRGTSLFSGIKADKVCSVCFKSGEAGEVIKCKGPCCNYFHVECSTLPRYQHSRIFSNRSQSKKKGRRGRPKSISKHSGKVENLLLNKNNQTSENQESENKEATETPSTVPSLKHNGVLENSIENPPVEDLSSICKESDSKLDTTVCGNTLFDSLSLVKADARKNLDNNNEEKTEDNIEDLNENIAEEKLEEKIDEDDQSECNLVINDDCTQDTEMSGIDDIASKEENANAEDCFEKICNEEKFHEKENDSLSLPSQEESSESKEIEPLSSDVDMVEETEPESAKDRLEDKIVEDNISKEVKTMDDNDSSDKEEEEEVESTENKETSSNSSRDVSKENNDQNGKVEIEEVNVTNTSEKEEKISSDNISILNVTNISEKEDRTSSDSKSILNVTNISEKEDKTSSDSKSIPNVTNISEKEDETSSDSKSILNVTNISEKEDKTSSDSKSILNVANILEKEDKKSSDNNKSNLNATNISEKEDKTSSDSKSILNVANILEKEDETSSDSKSILHVANILEKEDKKSSDNNKSILNVTNISEKEDKTSSDNKTILNVANILEKEDKKSSDNNKSFLSDTNVLEKEEKLSPDNKIISPDQDQIMEDDLKEEEGNESEEKLTMEIQDLKSEMKREFANDDKQSIDSDKSNDKQSIDSDKSQIGKTGWVCSQCIEGKDGPCFICGIESGDLIRCSTNHCGKVYHMKCLANWPQRQLGQSSKGKVVLSCPQHACHTCISDNPAAHAARFNYEKLVRCVACPSSYHHGNYCIPAGSELLSTTQMICPRHYVPLKDSLAHVNASWCSICAIGGSLICCDTCPNSFHAECLKIDPPEGSFICEDCETGRIPLYGEIVWVKLGAYRWWPARILYPLEVPENIRTMNHSRVGEFVVEFFGSHDYFWINRGRAFFYHEGDGSNILCKSRVDELFLTGMTEASEAFKLYQEERESREANCRPSMKPPKFVKILTNKPYGTLRSAENDVASMTACECDPEKENPCGRNSDCINRLLMVECNPQICPAGDKCQNQNFEKRLYPPLAPFKTESRGWGLQTNVDLKKGDFVIEYVGEMIDEEEYRRRVIRKQKNKDENYYFLTIDKDRMLDAGPKGNMARFMNHSCNPNCETQKWTVNGDTRVGLFTLMDIPRHTELVFNYNLETIGNTRVDCKCGAPFCGGYIGAKVNKPSEEKKTTVTTNNKKKKQPKKIGNSGANGNGNTSTSGANNKNSTTKVTENTCFTCGEGGELLLCDNGSCPKAYHLDCLGLTKHPPGNWECPRHVCSICSSTKVQRCTHCINSYCDKHAEGNITLHRTHGLVCFSCTPSESGSDWSGEPSEDEECTKKTEIPQTITTGKSNNANKSMKLTTSRRGRLLIPNGNLH